MPIPVIKVVGPHSFGTYEPGNGAKYTAVAVPWVGPNQSVGDIGWVDEGWLVVTGNGRAHLFQPKGFLTDDYIGEKLGGGWIHEEDIPHLAHLVRTLLGRPDLTTAEVASPHRDLDTIDLEHDQRLRDLRDPFSPRSF